jgi:hypothetical protein
MNWSNLIKFYIGINSFQGDYFNIAIKNILANLTRATHVNLHRASSNLCLEAETINAMRKVVGLDLSQISREYFPVKNCSADILEPDSTALDLPDLTGLSLYSNQLKNFPNLTLLSNLIHIRMYNNHLSQIPADALSGNTKLVKLELQTNRIVKMPKNSFSSCKVLDYLDMSYNQLVEAPDLTGGCDKLRFLLLRGNSITFLPANYFSGCMKLYKVDLGVNLFTAFPDFSMVGSTLHEVLIHANQIAGTMAPNNFKNLTRMNILNLSHNKIEHFDETSFLELLSVVHLNLRDNPIVRFGDPYRYCKGQTCKKLKLYLDYNPGTMLCDENRCWAKRFTAPIQVYMNGCFGKKWAQVTFEDLKCPSKYLFSIEWAIPRE